MFWRLKKHSNDVYINKNNNKSEFKLIMIKLLTQCAKFPYKLSVIYILLISWIQKFYWPYTEKIHLWKFNQKLSKAAT